MSRAPTTLILDLDGTLLDSRPAILACFTKAVAEVFPGRRLDVEKVLLGPPIRRMFQVSFPEATEGELDGLLGEFRRHYDREGPLKTAPYEGALDTLAHCKSRGLALDIATNKPLRISKAILAHLKMDHYFRSIAASDSVRPPFASKGEILRHLLQIHCLVEARTWYVGDSAEDAQACAECGLPFVWAAYGYGRLGEAEAKSVFRTIRSLVELKEILR